MGCGRLVQLRQAVDRRSPAARPRAPVRRGSRRRPVPRAANRCLRARSPAPPALHAAHRPAHSATQAPMYQRGRLVARRRNARCTLEISGSCARYSRFSKTCDSISRQRVSRVQARSPSSTPPRASLRHARAGRRGGPGSRRYPAPPCAAMAAIARELRHVQQARAAAPEITGRSGTASGSTTDGRSASAASEAVISICSQQIWRRCPKGIQHCA